MKTKAHTRYYNKEGTWLVGVTTVVGLEAKPFLVGWANNLGLEGVDCRKYKDEMADIGSCAHLIIQHKFKDGELNLDDYTPNQVEQAKVCVSKFDDWHKNNQFEVILCEPEGGLVSEKYQFGGTPDIYCDLRGKKTLVDFKTGGIYDSAFTQVSAYKQLLEENGYPVEEIKILKISRSEKETFDERRVYSTELHWNKFLNLLEIYNINKKLKV